jgi:hypothetical protein
MVKKDFRHTPVRNDKIQVVLNNEEKELILKKARDEGLPASTFIRWKLLKE